MKKQAFRKDLQELLSKYEVDKYSGLHNYMMSEHIVRWIEEYAREQNVAKSWSTDPQTSYYDYMREARHDTHPNNIPPKSDFGGQHRNSSVAQSHGEDPSEIQD